MKKKLWDVFVLKRNCKLELERSVASAELHCKSFEKNLFRGLHLNDKPQKDLTRIFLLFRTPQKKIMKRQTYTSIENRYIEHLLLLRDDSHNGLNS